MRRLIVLTLVLTMIFPTYCFASPENVVPIENEIIKEIMWIAEDGVVEEKEIEDLKTMYFDKNIEITQNNFVCHVLYPVAFYLLLGLEMIGLDGLFIVILMNPEVTLVEAGIYIIMILVIFELLEDVCGTLAW